MFKSFCGFVVAGFEDGCMLADWEPFRGEVGEFTVTSGGEPGAESEVVETGRCSILELCCRGRGTGGPAVPGPRGARAVPVVDDGEGVRGMSSEARVFF